MIPLFILVAGVSIFEISIMVKKKQKKEIIVFIFFALITLVFGLCYFLNPSKKSIIYWIMNILGLIY